jgi:hypothetical protein
MKGLAWILGASIALWAGCDTGSAGDDQPGDDDNDVVCTAELDIAGSFVQTSPPPTPETGCWPIGTWTFQATVVTNDCATAPTPGQESFRVDRDTAAPEPDFTWIYTYLTTPATNTADISVSSGGVGECEGQLLLFNSDGKEMWSLRPALLLDSSLAGHGTFSIHTRDQRSPPDN